MNNKAKCEIDNKTKLLAYKHEQSVILLEKMLNLFFNVSIRTYGERVAVDNLINPSINDWDIVEKNKNNPQNTKLS